MLLFYKEVRGRKVRAPHVGSGKFLKKLFKKNFKCNSSLSLATYLKFHKKPEVYHLETFY